MSCINQFTPYSNRVKNMGITKILLWRVCTRGMDGTGGVIVLGVGEVLFRVVTSRELATCDRVHVGPFRALAPWLMRGSLRRYCMVTF